MPLWLIGVLLGIGGVIALAVVLVVLDITSNDFFLSHAPMWFTDVLDGVIDKIVEYGQRNEFKNVFGFDPREMVGMEQAIVTSRLGVFALEFGMEIRRETRARQSFEQGQKVDRAYFAKKTKKAQAAFATALASARYFRFDVHNFDRVQAELSRDPFVLVEALIRVNC